MYALIHYRLFHDLPVNNVMQYNDDFRVHVEIILTRVLNISGL